MKRKPEIEEKVKKFDRLLETYEDYNFVIAKFIKYLLEGIWIWMMLVPVQEMDHELWPVCFLGGILSAVAVSIYFANYITVKEGAKTSDIYQKLKYIPVGAEDIFCQRMDYLLHYCKVKLIICLCMQIFMGLLLRHSLSIWNILYPVFWVAAVTFLPGLFVIFPWKRGVVQIFLYWVKF